MDKCIGRAECLATSSLWIGGSKFVAGVVRLKQGNKVVMARVSRKGAVTPVTLRHRRRRLDKNPAFGCWPSATLREAQEVIRGKVHTHRQGSLGCAYSQDSNGFLGVT